MTAIEEHVRDDSGEGYRFCWGKVIPSEVTKDLESDQLIDRLERVVLEFDQRKDPEVSSPLLLGH